jgi:hypothetical protein
MQKLKKLMNYYFPLTWMRNLTKFDGEERIRHAQNNGTSVGICSTLGMVSFIEWKVQQLPPAMYGHEKKIIYFKKQNVIHKRKEKCKSWPLDFHH